MTLDERRVHRRRHHQQKCVRSHFQHGREVEMRLLNPSSSSNSSSPKRSAEPWIHFCKVDVPDVTSSSPSDKELPIFVPAFRSEVHPTLESSDKENTLEEESDEVSVKVTPSSVKRKDCSILCSKKPKWKKKVSKIPVLQNNRISVRTSAESSSTLSLKKVESLKRTPNIAKHKSKAKVGKDTKTVTASSRIERLNTSPKPWRRNMTLRLKEIKEVAAENKESEMKTEKKDNLEEKPWRKNMKADMMVKVPELLPEDVCPTKKSRKDRSDLEEVRNYISEKNKIRKTRDVQQRKISDDRREAIRTRLLELDLYRQRNINKPSPKKKVCPVHGRHRLKSTEPSSDSAEYFRHRSSYGDQSLYTSDLTSEPSSGFFKEQSNEIPSSEAFSRKELHKKKLEDKLRAKLEELTLEMRRKTTKIPSSLEPEKSSATDLEPVKESTSKESSIRNEDLSSSSLSKKTSKTPCSVDTVISQHNRDLELIKKSNVGLLPQRDPFNFLSTVKRKMDSEISKEKISEKPSPRSTPIEDNTLSDGQISTSIASLSVKKSKEKDIEDKKVPQFTSSSSLSSTSSSLVTRGSKDKTGISASVSSSSDLLPEKDPNPCINQQVVPGALHLRFLAELNQLESVQSAEKQVDHLHCIKETSIIRQKDAVNMANRIKVIEKKKPKKVRETRAEFEARIRQEFQELLQSKLMTLIESQTEATRITADAAKQLALLQNYILQLQNEKKVHKSNSINPEEEPLVVRSSVSEFERPVRDVSEISKPSSSSAPPEEVLSMISKTESSIPSVLSVLQKASRSGDDIRKTISEAISGKFEEEECSSSSSSAVTLNTANISEEIEKEITSSKNNYSSSFELSKNEEFSTSIRNREKEDVSDKGLSLMSTSSLVCNNFSSTSSESFTKFNLRMIEQHIRAESTRAKNQYVLLKLREKEIIKRAKREITELEKEKKELKSEGKDITRIRKKQESIAISLHSQREEINGLKTNLKVAEKERQFVLREQKRLIKGRKKLLNSPEKSLSSSPSLNSSADTVVPSTNKEDKELLEVKKSVEHSKNDAKITIRGSNDVSEDSLINVSISSDHSDVDIRVNTLKDELQRRISMAQRLKRQQKTRNKENLKAQEEALKKQIEAYDKLISRTREEITQDVKNSVVSGVPPQIKTPGNRVRSRGESNDTSFGSQTDKTSEIDESSFCSSSTTVVSETRRRSKSSAHRVDHICNSIIESIIKESAQNLRVLRKELFSREEERRKECESHLKKKIREESSVLTPGRTTKRPQDLMLTTFDLDLDEDVPSQTEAPSPPKPSIPTFDDEDGNNENEMVNNEYGEDFIDDDFGLSSIREESEQIRQQQMRIEEESEGDKASGTLSSLIHFEKRSIRDLHVTKVQRDLKIHQIHQESNTYVVVKPPPPYEPPVSSDKSLILRRIPVLSEVPDNYYTSSKNLRNIVPKIVNKFREGGQVDSEFLKKISVDEEEKFPTNPDWDPLVFLECLADSVRETLDFIFSGENEKQNPPWMRQKILLKTKCLPKSDNECVEKVLTEMLVLFGRKSRSLKDNLVVRWSHKKRSKVDAVLVRELQAEDQEWTDYNNEETNIKDTIAQEIFEELIKDVVSEVKRLG